MNFSDRQFSELINEVAKNQVIPAHTRSLFPVQAEVSAAVNVDYIKHVGNALSGDWAPAGSATGFDSYSVELSSGNSPVIERRLAISMTHFDRLMAGEGKTLNLSDRIAQLLGEVEVEIDEITFNGKGGVKSVTNDVYYGNATNKTKGITLTSPATFASATDDQLKSVLLQALTASKGDGRFLGKKTLLLNSANYNVLRSKHIGDSSVTLLDYLKTNAPELGEIREIPGLKEVLVYENNPSYVSARFTFPLQQVGPTKDEGGTLTAFFISRYAGIVVKNPKTLVRITGV